MNKDLDDIYDANVAKYTKITGVLSTVYSNYTHVDNDEMKRHKSIVKEILESIIDKMCEADRCFDELHTEIIINGSVGDDLKVDKADEFDWDIVLELPRCVGQILTFSNIPGFVHVECQLPRNLPKVYRKLNNFVDEKGYLLTSKVRQWIESLVHRVLKNCSYSGAYEINGCWVTIKKIRPGFTMLIEGPWLSYPISVDVVATFEFNSEFWPQGKFRRPPNNEDTFFIVPKETTRKIGGTERYWRLSAQEQEWDVLHHKYNMKPCLMLLKKVRDNMKLNDIASYYIKTVCMNELEKSNEEFWKDSMSYCFLYLLKALATCFEKNELAYYWNKNDNLIENLDDRKCKHIAGQLRRIYNRVVHSRDPKEVLKFVLSNEDFNAFQTERRYTNKNNAYFFMLIALILYLVLQ